MGAWLRLKACSMSLSPYNLRFYVHIYVDPVKRDVITSVGEIPRYRKNCIQMYPLHSSEYDEIRQQAISAHPPN